MFDEPLGKHERLLPPVVEAWTSQSTILKRGQGTLGASQYLASARDHPRESSDFWFL